MFIYINNKKGQFHRIGLFVFYFISNLISFGLGQDVLLDYLLFAQAICYLAAVIGILLRPSGILGKIVSVPAYFVVVNAAGLRALYLTLTTDLEATWETNVY